MKIQSIHTVVFSPTGTSKKTAAAVARGIQNSARDASTLPTATIDLTHAQAQALTLPHDSVAIFAVPVYGGHVAPTAYERMGELHGDATPAVVVALYGNRAFDKAPAELSAFVAQRGFVPIAATAFVGEHSYSTDATPIAAARPDASDLAAAEAFGEAVGRKLAAIVPAKESPDASDLHHAMIDASKLRTPSTPLWPLLRFIRFVIGYRRRQKRNPVVLLPAGDAARCTQCGRCAAICPVQAISKEDFLHASPTRCIRCNACVKACPVGARTFDTPFAAQLARNFARRKPPVTML